LFFDNRWIFDNTELVANKKVFELGAGCGLCGILAGMHSNTVAISDYTREIVKIIKTNVDLNSKLLGVTPQVM
jgi:predicted nicotinamide N-methyase